MNRLLVLFLVLSTMGCLVWAFEDYEEPVQGRPGQHNFGYARVDTPLFQKLRNGPTTVRNYIETASTNTNMYINASDNTRNSFKNNNKRKSQEYEGGMIYPPDLSIALNQIKSRNCSYGLCDEVDNYPIEKIERILNQSELKKFFSTVQLGSRFGDTDEGDNLCATVTHTRFPKTAKNINNKEQVIVNVEQYKQGIEFETCKDQGPCSFAENFPNNFTPKCVQRYTVRKLMVVGKESDDTVFDYFRIPSCCVCMVKK